MSQHNSTTTGAAYSIARENREIGKGAATVVSTKMTRPQMFNKTLSKISEFIMACRLYIRIKMREVIVEKQIQ